VTYTKDPPHVSVIIPTYNRASMLGRAIQSVLDQTYRDFELIVVDDCSSDDTQEVTKGFADDRIRYIKHPTNRGGSAARNTGIRSSRGDYIGLLDDDDEWLPNKLELQVDLLDRLPEDYGVVYSGYRSEQSGKILGEYSPIHRGDVYHQMLKSCFIGSPTILIRKICFDNAGRFDEALPSCQDWDMWIRLAKHYKFDFLPEVLAVYNIHGDQIKFNLLKYVCGVNEVLAKHGEDISKNKKILSYQYRYLAILYYAVGDKAEGTKFMLKSIKLNPLQNGIVHISAALIAPRFYKMLIIKALIRSKG